MTVTSRTTLGVPFLPPALISEASTRLRDRLGRLHRSLAPPPVRLIESALGLLDHRVLVSLCASGVPDALTRPATTAQLAERLDLDPVRLERLIRFAATRGWLRIGRNGVIHANRTTAFMRQDHPGGWRSWIDFLGLEGVVAAVGHLDARRGADPFVEANGQPFFEWMAVNPAAWATFDSAMAAGGRMHALTLDAAMDWGSIATVCDVGGGMGDLLRALLDLHPTWRGAVFDLPKVIERAGTHPRLEHLAGDAFEAVPSGFDAYLLVNVLHDWNYSDATTILRNVAAALGTDGRVIVVDNRSRAVPIDEIAVLTDVLMAALTDGGQERSTAEFAELGHAAGLNLTESRHLASGDVAHVFRPQGAGQNANSRG